MARVKSRTLFIRILKSIIGDYYWKKRRSILFILSIILSYILLATPYLREYVHSLGEFGYVGAFAVGALFTSFMTTLPATAALFVMGEGLNPFLIALIGAMGAVMGDYIIYRFVKDDFLEEVEDFSPTLKRDIELFSQNVRRSKFLKEFVPLLAGLIIASPLPDELAATMLGITKLDPKKFLLYSYFFNFLGILLISSAGKFL